MSGGLLAALLAAGPGAPAGAGGTPPDERAVHRSSADDGVRVLVWDVARTGVDVWAADPDGTDRRRLHHSARGYATSLTISRDGREVAINPETRRGPGRLLVVPTDGSTRAVDLLRGRDEVVGVGVLDWSPGGGRIAFEGFVDEPSAGMYYPSYLFTVRTDGTGLRRHGRLGDGSGNGQVFGAMTWTRHGIAVPMAEGLVLIDGPLRRTLVARAFDVRPSGDRRWIFFHRTRDHGRVQTLWRVRPDGRRSQLVATSEDDFGNLLGAVPDLHGRHVLYRQYDEGGVRPRFLSFTVAEPHVVVEVPIPGHAMSVAWR